MVMLGRQVSELSDSSTGPRLPLRPIWYELKKIKIPRNLLKLNFHSATRPTLLS